VLVADLVAKEKVSPWALFCTEEGAPLVLKGRPEWGAEIGVKDVAGKGVKGVQGSAAGSESSGLRMRGFLSEVRERDGWGSPEKKSMPFEPGRHEEKTDLVRSRDQSGASASLVKRQEGIGPSIALKRNNPLHFRILGGGRTYVLRGLES